MDVESSIRELEEEIGKNLKDEQKEIIKNTIKQNDSFVILPTGYGKSFCFGLYHKVVSRVSISIQFYVKEENVLVKYNK